MDGTRKSRRRGRARSARLVVAGLCASLASALGSAPAASSPILLEDRSALLQFDPASTTGVTSWTLDGVTHLRSQSLWFRVGDAGPESPLADLVRGEPLASDTNASGRADTLFQVFSDPRARFEVELRLSLLGAPFAGPAAGTSADLAAQIALVNRSEGPLELSLFQFTDVDLFGSFSDDVLELGGSGTPNTARITDASGLGLYESVWTPRPDAVEATLFDQSLASLEDDTPTALSGATQSTGDVTLTVAWQARLPAGGALLLSQDQSIRVASIPEPRLAWLLALAGLALLGRSSGACA